MQARGIPTAIHYPMPLHRQPVFAHLELREGRYPRAEAAARRVISLPMHAYLSEEHQEQVVQAVRESAGTGEGERVVTRA
jgi:UDP-2-acetamido-2-deoxy-ribo-hexuluronate aminotransferase